MKNNNDAAVSQFIINVALVDPITDILNKLKTGSFRDCDIKWLEKKLNGFVSFAAQTLGISNLSFAVEFKEDFPFMNDYVKKHYTDKFTTLLNYFKTL